VLQIKEFLKIKIKIIIVKFHAAVEIANKLSVANVDSAVNNILCFLSYFFQKKVLTRQK
jgi:hypothetical protein